MGKTKLVIVESPTKARTISGILGKDYKLLASMGHVRDLPKNQLGIDIKDNFSPKYVASKTKTLNDLSKAAKDVDEIFLATDPDREGEAIAWHLKEVLNKKKKVKFNRVEFHEITKSAIKSAFDNPREIDIKLVNSQQARRILDRLVGYQVSPLLWSRIKKNISAGRVQSVALRIVCEREREILNFIPKEYWNFTADFLWKEVKENLYSGKLHSIDGKKAEIPDQENAERIYKAIENKLKCFIKSNDQKTVYRRASAPFITSSLQQTAGNTLRFSASRTMQIAQQLYEGIEMGDGQTTGLITYMRTDSVTLSQEAINNCREYIKTNYGDKYLPLKPNYYKNKSNAQEAHEAIRPTNVTISPESIRDRLSPEQFKLYNLIWKRFVSCQMSPAQISRTTVDTQVNGSDNISYIFRTVNSVTVFDGFLKLSTQQSDDETGPSFLTQIKEADTSAIDKLNKEQKFTEPPPRYTEPSLIKELESNGIGRPSTYASIINTILKREYIIKEKGKLIPQDLGFKVNDYLVKFLDELFNIGFTAEMENKLDEIEVGKEEWTKMLEEFYHSLAQWVDTAKYKAAPEQAKVQCVFNILDKIDNWDTSKPAGKRAKGDGPFYESIKKQYDKNNKLTDKQWESVLKLAVKYQNDIKDLDSASKELGFYDDIEAIRTDIKEREKINLEKQEKFKGITESCNKVFEMLPKEVIDKFEFSSSPRFNEETFFKSLVKRSEEGGTFSDKQKNVLCRILTNNQEHIDSFEKIKDILGIDDTPAQEDPKSNEELDSIFVKFENFNSWNEPQKKGRRTYDDKSFFESLKNQYRSKKNLSSKQIYALKKLHNKYFEKK